MKETGGAGRYKVATGGPRGRADAKTRRGPPARTGSPSYLAVEENGSGTTTHLHFTHQLVFVGTLTSAVKHFEITAHMGPGVEGGTD